MYNISNFESYDAFYNRSPQKAIRQIYQPEIHYSKQAHHQEVQMNPNTPLNTTSHVNQTYQIDKIEDCMSKLLSIVSLKEKENVFLPSTIQIYCIRSNLNLKL